MQHEAMKMTVEGTHVSFLRHTKGTRLQRTTAGTWETIVVGEAFREARMQQRQNILAAVRVQW